LHELIREVLRALCREDKLRDQGECDWHVVVCQVAQRVQGQVHDVCFGHLRRNRFDLLIKAVQVEGDVENLQDVRCDHAACIGTTA